VKILIEMTPARYEGLLESCGKSSREYSLLKNGLVLRQEGEGVDHRKVAIMCEIADAARLYAAASRLNPTTAATIAKDIALARDF
jgi:hypothetical protein